MSQQSVLRASVVTEEYLLYGCPKVYLILFKILQGFVTYIYWNILLHSKCQKESCTKYFHFGGGGGSPSYFDISSSIIFKNY